MSHVNVSPSRHPPAAQPAQVGGPRSHEGRQPDRTSSQPGGLLQDSVDGREAKQWIVILVLGALHGLVDWLVLFIFSVWLETKNEIPMMCDQTLI